MIVCEVVLYDVYGMLWELFLMFFGIVRDMICEVFVDEWLLEMVWVWDKLFVGIEVEIEIFVC